MVLVFVNIQVGNERLRFTLKTSQTGCQPYNDIAPYKISLYSLMYPSMPLAPQLILSLKGEPFQVVFLPKNVFSI